MEFVLLGSSTARAFLIIIEIEQLVIALAIGQNTASSEAVPTTSQTDIQRTLADDAHVVGIEFGPYDGILVTVGSHDDKCVIVDPGMGVLTGIVGILFKRSLLDHLHLVVLELQLHETVGRNRHLIVVLTFDNSLHRVVCIYLCTCVLEVHNSTLIQPVATLHDSSHIASHTALFAHGNGEVEMVRSIHDRRSCL